ncbi:hypothetical protein Hdeb2414_s0010g00341911 [Helianthus debilis subsp. tardiflorus]
MLKICNFEDCIADFNSLETGGVFVLVRQSQKAGATARVSISALCPMFFTIEIHSIWGYTSSSYRGVILTMIF